jgi:hypothetical protein
VSVFMVSLGLPVILRTLLAALVVTVSMAGVVGTGVEGGAVIG